MDGSNRIGERQKEQGERETKRKISKCKEKKEAKGRRDFPVSPVVHILYDFVEDAYER